MSGQERVAGVDEAGRGPLAGPVVAAAVILDARRPVSGIADSKRLAARERHRLAALIRGQALAVGVGWADPREIDALDILRATFLAMRRAVLALPHPPSRLLVDGHLLPSLAGLPGVTEARALVRGDANDIAIGAASIVAKTARDEYMRSAHSRYPQYAFDAHKGYGTVQHLERLARHGPCPLHRLSFAPVAAARARLEAGT